MARISGVDLPQAKHVEIALMYIFGIGRTRSRKILDKANVAGNIKVKDLAEDEVRRIGQVIQEEGGVEGDLRKNVAMDIKRLMDIGSYRGMRHRRSLPARGQRTHTNARTKKGPRRAIPGKKKAPGGKKG
ncbi:MAG: 30S ribosomal protein S13 [Acidobacteriota bacterium]|jgi:small subunit ribosomal protein S13